MMSDDMLSQEEINALLNGISSDDNTTEASNAGDTQVRSDIKEPLTADERDAIGEISNISMGTASTTLSTLVNQRVTITTPVVSYACLYRLHIKKG